MSDQALGECDPTAAPSCVPLLWCTVDVCPVAAASGRYRRAAA